MPKLTFVFLISICVVAASCAANKNPGSAKQESISAITPPASPSVSPAGGFTPEAGDTSAAEFSGTAGIVEKKRLEQPSVILKEVRTARHTSFDRVVFEFAGDAVPGYRVEYFDKPPPSCGSGDVVSVSGNGFLLVQLMPANAHSEDGQPTIIERERTPDLPVLKQMKLICDFEADVQWVFGVSAPNRYRVLELSNPTRLVVDIRH